MKELPVPALALLTMSIAALLSGCGTLEVAAVIPTAAPTSTPTTAGRVGEPQPSPTPPPTPFVPSPTATLASADGPVRYLGVNQVQGVIFTEPEVIWAATTGGAVRWDLATGAHVQYTTSDGLPSDYLTDVAQAPDGGLWFATLGGVSRLSEGAWTSYTESDGLVDNAVQSLAVAPDGTVWAGTTEGIGRFDGQTWTTHRPGERVWDIAVAPDGAVWFAADAAGLHRYTPVDDAWATFRPEDDPFAAGIKTVALAPDGAAWVYLGYDRLYRFIDGQWQPVYEADGQWVTDVAFEADGTPWVATGDGYRAHGAGLATRDDGAWRLIDRGDGLASDSVQTVALGPDGRIAAGTHRGLSVQRGAEWRTLRYGPAVNRITTVAVAPSGEAWFGFGTSSFPPAGGGVSRFDDRQWESFNPGAGFPINDNVRFLTVDRTGALWAAGGCELAYRSSDTWYEAAGCDDLQGNVVDVALGRDDTLWVATDFNVYRLGEGPEVVGEQLLPTSLVVTSDEATLPNTVLVSQSPMGEGGVWFYQGAGWEPLVGSPHCLVSMVVDDRDAVWALGCEDGALYRWIGGSWQDVTDDDGLPPGRIIDIAASPEGHLAVVTEGGSARLSAAGWVAQERTWQSTIHDMALAPDGTIWLATSHGALRIAP